MASAASVGPSAVFQKGPHPVVTRHIYPCEVRGLPKPLMAVTPTDAGIYPVLLFLHGWFMWNSFYESLLKHVASHGFVVVAPQLYWLAINLNDAKEIDGTRELVAWLAGDERHGRLPSLLHSGVEPDLKRLALAGHSRGGDTAFAVTLGLQTPHQQGRVVLGPETPAAPKFSALVGVDPVAAVHVPIINVNLQVQPEVLKCKAGSLHTGMPVLVIGTGKGPEGIVPCAPEGMNHAEFYKESAPPRYHFVAKEYGHQDMLDDGLPAFGCAKSDKGEPKDDARRAMGGLMVAFLRAKLQGDDRALRVVRSNPEIAPAVLRPVEYDDPAGN